VISRRWLVAFASAAVLVGGFLSLPASAQVSIVQALRRASFHATSHYIVGTADTSGVRLDLESGFLACREGDDSAYCTGIRALIYQARQDGIGTTSTDGVRLMNSTAAAAGAQQYSPRTCWEGQGWKTNATAASQSVVFCAETQPVQGTSAPTGNFILKVSINGGAFSTVGTFSSDGQLIVPTAIVAGAVTPLATELIQASKAGANGVWLVNVNNSTSTNALQIGVLGDAAGNIITGGIAKATVLNNTYTTGGYGPLILATSAEGRQYLHAGGGVSFFSTTDPGTGVLAVTGKVSGSTWVQTTATTVAALPTCNAGAKGARSFVTDANATTFLSTVAAGGANNVPVVCDGTNWVIG
jgi:hypothetical protein